MPTLLKHMCYSTILAHIKSPLLCSDQDIRSCFDQIPKNMAATAELTALCVTTHVASGISYSMIANFGQQARKRHHPISFASLVLLY